jgi:hypothetical protein
MLHLRALTCATESEAIDKGCLSLSDDSRKEKRKRCGDEQTLQQTYSRVSGSARCVQNFDDSLSFAIRMTYRISLRSSSLWEPRHPLLKVFYVTSYSLPNRGSSEYNEFTIKMLVSHHTSRKWIIKVGRTAETDCQNWLKVHGSYHTYFTPKKESEMSRQVEVW